MAANLTLTYGALNLTAYPYGIEFGMDTGAPQNVYETLAFLLQDGEVALSDRASNRTLTFNIMIEGASLAALAQAEAALIAETDAALNTITIDPGDGAPASVYETYRGQVTLARDDNGEIARIRRYTVTVASSAFVRSTAEVVVPALSSSGTTTTLVDSGSATTGWSGTVNGSAATVAVSSGAVGTTSAAIVGQVMVTLTRAGSITTSSTKYLMVDWRGMANTPLVAVADGVTLDRISQTSSPTAGYARTWFYVAASSVSSLSLSQTSYVPSGQYARPLYVDNINRTDIRPSLGTARQLLRSITVQGSARTQGRLAIESETSGLGYVIAYSWTGGAEGYSPPLRQYRVSGGTVTTDTSRISGATEPIKSTTITYEIPVSRLNSGTHILACKLDKSGSGTAASIAYTSQTFLGSNAISALTSGTSAVQYTTIIGASYTIVTRLQLPSVEVNPNSGAFQRITLNATTDFTGLIIDEGWLFNTSIGQLSMVWSDGSGTPTVGLNCNRMYFEPATSVSPRPVVKIGTNADRSDARTPREMQAWQQPIFPPSAVNVFTVTPAALDSNVSLAYYPRWHTHAAS